MNIGNRVEHPASRLKSTIVYIFVFISGFISLASEIIGPRLFASSFGTTTIVWAVMISVSLGGLSLGYYLAGRFSPKRAKQVLPIVLVINALWLLAASWLVWDIPAVFHVQGLVSISAAALLAFFVPFTLFGMISPISITLLAEGQVPERISRTVGNIYGLSTVGSVVGALVAAFGLIPVVGLSASLRIFALILVLFAIYFWARSGRFVGLVVLAIAIIIPQPTFQWYNQGDVLLTQREGYFQTLRLYTDPSHRIILFRLGPSWESEFDTKTKAPLFDYARSMVDLAGDVQGKRILSIGGAGHSMARALEDRGALVTEVEIDPVVIETSDEFFGPLQGDEINQDGRAYLNQVAPGTFDYIFVDAYYGPTVVPAQLTTVECFQAIKRALNPTGRMLYNFSGSPGSKSFLALAGSMYGAFPHVYASSTTGNYDQNIILMASAAQITGFGVKAPNEGLVLTDDINPIDLFLLEDRGGSVDYQR